MREIDDRRVLRFVARKGPADAPDLAKLNNLRSAIPKIDNHTLVREPFEERGVLATHHNQGAVGPVKGLPKCWQWQGRTRGACQR